VAVPLSAVHVLAVRVDLRLTGCRSLKEKRSRLRPVVEGIRSRFRVSVAETGFQDTWQRAEVGVAVVAGSAGQATSIADEVERFVWSQPDVEVGETTRHWLEMDR
jgi:uncharacterized protein YlxP (DUF503 family)